MAQAQWQGTPHVKGSSESMRMLLLTFSLIGLQYVRVFKKARRQVLILTIRTDLHGVLR
jgi:hypothetical protein